MPAEHMLLLGVAGAAAVTDWRTGLIPNWLTLPALFVALLLALLSSPAQLLFAAAGALTCGAVPYVGFRMGAVGGGDVKLFAALGGLGGVVLGLEILMYSLMAAVVFALIAMAVRGQAMAVLRNTGRILLRPFVRTRAQEPLSDMEMHTIRLGAPIFAATVLVVGLPHVL